MDLNFKNIQEKIALMSEPNSGYTYDDFEKEFNTNNHNVDMFKINFNFKNESNNPDPEYATVGSSGFDLRANLTEQITIKPHSFKIIPTGLYFEIPENFEIQIRPRSGLAAKNGVTVLNTPGTIDADYRGEIKILLINLSNEPFIINDAERIAQMIIAKHEQIEWQVVDKLSDTERGAGGYGHTGK